MECNGTNLLLVLEGYIHYSAFSFSFILQLPLWRSAVRACNWTGLLHCLKVLEGSLNGKFNNPTQVDISLANVDLPLLELEPDIDTEEPPFYEPESRDPEVIRAQSDGERTRAVNDVKQVGAFGEQWAETRYCLLNRSYENGFGMKNWEASMFTYGGPFRGP